MSHRHQRPGKWQRNAIRESKALVNAFIEISYAIRRANQSTDVPMSQMSMSRFIDDIVGASILRGKSKVNKPRIPNKLTWCRVSR